MKKIAIILTSESSSYYDENYQSSKAIVTSITDWKEVDDETYKMLVDAGRYKNFQVIEQPNDIDAFILNTVDDCLVMLAKQKKAEDQRKEEEAKRKEAAAEKRRQKALLKLAKDEASEKELLAALLKKHGATK